MKSTFIWLVVFILVLFGGIYLVNNGSPRSPENSTPTSTPPTQNQPDENKNGKDAVIPPDFRDHAEPEQHYRIGIPFNVDVSNPQTGITRYRYVGPNNEPGSEITDGYTVTVDTQPTNASSVENLVAQRLDTNATTVIEEPQSVTIAGNKALRYVTESALGSKPITNYALLPDNGYAYYIRINLSSTNDETYKETAATIVGTLEFLDEATAESLRSRIVPIAMLDYRAVDGQYIRESNGTERGCDSVVLIEHVLPASTTTPLTASLQQLFSYEQDTVGGWQNFIASQNKTLSFSRAEISGGTAKIFLTGELGPLGGVCDNPRAAIQIEETALAYDTVDSVELYLNNKPTDLTPSGRGE